MTSTFPDIYAFKGAHVPLDVDSYRSAVLVTAGAVLDRAVATLGDPRRVESWGASTPQEKSTAFREGLVDFVNNVYLADMEAVRLVLAVSPNFLKLRPDDAKDAIENAKDAKDDEEFLEMLFGQPAYRIFERDLWDALTAVASGRYGVDLWDTLSE